MLHSHGENGYPRLGPDLRGKALSFTNEHVGCQFFLSVLYHIKEVPFLVF